MSEYAWKTRMYDSETMEEHHGLLGQAGVTILDNGLVRLTVMPDRGCFAAICTLSLGEMLKLAGVIIDAAQVARERGVPIHPMGTEEYETYAAELKAELKKFATGQPPYEFSEPTTLERIQERHDSRMRIESDQA